MEELDVRKSPYEDYAEEEGISLRQVMDIVRRLLSKKKPIALFTLLFAVLGVVIALGQKRVYMVSMTLAPEMQNRNATVENITSMLGVSSSSFGDNTDAMNITLFPEICKSSPFLCRLFDVPVTPYVSAEDAAMGRTSARARANAIHLFFIVAPLLYSFLFQINGTPPSRRTSTHYS